MIRSHNNYFKTLSLNTIVQAVEIIFCSGAC